MFSWSQCGRQLLLIITIRGCTVNTIAIVLVVTCTKALHTLLAGAWGKDSEEKLRKEMLKKKDPDEKLREQVLKRKGWETGSERQGEQKFGEEKRKKVRRRSERE